MNQDNWAGFVLAVYLIGMLETGAALIWWIHKYDLFGIRGKK